MLRQFGEQKRGFEDWRLLSKHMPCEFLFLGVIFFFIIYHGDRDGEMTFLPIFLQHILFLEKNLAHPKSQAFSYSWSSHL